MAENYIFTFQDLRKEYGNRGLTRQDLLPSPFQLFNAWFLSAKESGAMEPNAFLLSTATNDGKPSCRALLMKHFDEDGLLFFTNYGSRKAYELDANPYAAITFWWGNIERQIRMEGTVKKTSREISEEYFAHRPRKSQLGAWASRQDMPVHAKSSLESAYSQAEKLYEGKDIPCPRHWGGYRFTPATFEFWQGSEARLHDRFLYLKEGGNWNITRLSP
ncbi:MAG: pyridoxamine 5'-phosphate oxidase [Parachlamydiales bacterium]|jgi:pyridoxamine 5'-phosphate oxidase